MLLSLKIAAALSLLAGSVCLAQPSQRIFLVGLILAFVTAPMTALAAVLYRRIMSGIEIYHLLHVQQIGQVDAEYRR